MKAILISTFEVGAYAHLINKALRQIGYTVFRFNHRMQSPLTVNENLEGFCDATDPDLIFTIKGRGIDPKIIKNQPAKKVLWWLDNATRFVDFEDYQDVYDKTYLIEEGQGYPWMAIGIDPDIHCPNVDSDAMYKSDIVFAGTAHPERSRRIWNILRYLECETAVWGNSWADLPILRGDAIYFKNLMKVYTMSKIILNNHYVKGITPNMRTIEAPASGTVMLSDTGEGINSCLKPGKEYIPYETEREARYLTMKYLEDEEEREKIAKAGYDRIHKDFLLVDILKEMIK